MSEKRMMATADTLKALRDEKAALQTKLKEVQADIDSVEALQDEARLLWQI